MVLCFFFFGQGFCVSFCFWFCVISFVFFQGFFPQVPMFVKEFFFFQKKKVFFSNFLFMRLVFPQSDCSLFQVRLMFCFVFSKKKRVFFFSKEFSFLFKGFFFFRKIFFCKVCFQASSFSKLFFQVFLFSIFFQCFLASFFFPNLFASKLFHKMKVFFFSKVFSTKKEFFRKKITHQRGKGFQKK